MLFNVYKLELSCEQGVQSSYCLLNEPGEQVAFLFVFDFKNILFLKRMEGKCFNCNCATLDYVLMVCTSLFKVVLSHKEIIAMTM